MKKINAIFMISIMLVLTFGTITINAAPRDRVESEIQTELTVNCKTLFQRYLNAQDAMFDAWEAMYNAYHTFGVESSEYAFAVIAWDAARAAEDAAAIDYAAQCHPED